MMRIFLMILNCFIFSLVHGIQIPCEIEQGTLILGEFLEASSSSLSIANKTPSPFLYSTVLGEIVQYNGNAYEIRVVSFEDTQNCLQADTTFKEYIGKNHLLSMQSCLVYPMPGLIFEVFDFRQAGLSDGVYFTIVLRRLPFEIGKQKENAEVMDLLSL